MTIVEEITHQQSETARTIWEKRGRLIPRVWAQGLDSMILAEPATAKAIEIMDEQKMATLLTAMAVRVEAIAVGRSDEVYYHHSDRPIETGDLRQLIETDPEVRSSIICEAVAIGGSEEVMVLSIHHLDDHGNHEWEVHQGASLERRSTLPLHVARDLIAEGLPDFWRDPIALKQYASQMGWIIQTFPEPISW